MTKKQSLKHIFLLSHMRANTSLMGHVLGSHSQISGYYEMHRSYLDKEDLLMQKKQYLHKDCIEQSSIYLFDKLLHNKYQLILENMDITKIKVLISIRSPEQSIKSIVHLFHNKNMQHSYADPVLAVGYYRERMASLVNFCQKYKGHYYYYDADLLRSRPQKILVAMQDWLSLNSPLREQYQFFAQTGCTGAGDSSENMKKGRIVKKQCDYNEVVIPSALLDKVSKEVYKQRKIIIEHAVEGVYW